jgi:lipoate-protein ligase A
MSSSSQLPPVAEWKFLNSGFHSGAHNMYVDQLLARRMVEQVGLPTLRTYGWDPRAISLGYNQRRHDLDETKCLAQGIDIVRRPTGGRAILHADELTYSVVMYAEGKSISQIYCDISKALVRGLRTLGADVEYSAVQADFSHLYRNQNSIPCFASSARYEIQYRGRKLVGSAQRRYTSPDGDEVVLQHGSILLGPAHKKLSELVQVQSEELSTSIRRELEMKTIELSSILGRNISFDEVAIAVKGGFENEWNIVFNDDNFDESNLKSDLSYNISSNEKVAQ